MRGRPRKFDIVQLYIRGRIRRVEVSREEHYELVRLKKNGRLTRPQGAAEESFVSRICNRIEADPEQVFVIVE